MRTDNIILIGMPGAGKSTVGVVLAKRLGFRFVDSDLVMQETFGKLLHELIEEYGQDGFRVKEGEVNASLTGTRQVIATGGSAVYDDRAMQHLRELGTVVYLCLGFHELERRLGDLNARGVTMKPGQTLRDLYEERIPLYEKYAHVILDCDTLSLRETIDLAFQNLS